MKTLRLAVAVVLAGLALHGQTQFDTSGDNLLSGAYRFRWVAALNINANGDPSEVLSAFGVINFDGMGSYTISGTYVDNLSKANSVSGFGTGGVQQPLNVTSGQGLYKISSNGTGFIANPLVPNDNTSVLLGAVGQGVFIGSNTESGFDNDLFIAIPVGTPPTNSSFTDPYWVGLLDFPAGVSSATKNAMFKLTPNGQGGFGSLTIKGFAANQGGTSLTQTSTGGTYSFAGDGNATLNIPTPSGTSATNSLFSGAKSMFVSSDGNYVLGWTPSGYDIFFGVRSRSALTSSSFAGVYYVGGVEDFPGCGTPGSASCTDNFYGSMVANGLGSQTMDQRLQYYSFYAYDYVCSDTVQFNVDGTGSVASPPCPTYQYGFSDSGNAFVAIGSPGDYALMAGVHSTTPAASGLTINPSAIFNAASYAPVTAGVAPGELITMYVSGLPAVEDHCVGGQPCPNIMDGVQVVMNGLFAPIFSISAANGTISAIVPYGVNVTTQNLVAIQVVNGNSHSNTVTLYVDKGLPGFFSYTQNGLGPAIAEHPSDFSLITPSNPAKPGETIVLVLTGLGAVTPGIADGAVPSLTTLSYSNLFNSQVLNAQIDDYANGVFPAATITFAGLAPGFAAEYQMNLTLPNNIGPGNVYLEVYDVAEQGLGFDINQVQIPVGASGSAVSAQARPGTPARAPHRNLVPFPKGAKSTRVP